jgi:hypothetical protein
MPVQDVMEHDEAAREFVDCALRQWCGVPGVPEKRFSIAALIGFLAIGRGMRLVFPYTKGRNPRLVGDPTFKFVGVYPIPVPPAIAKEMIESGLMKKLDYPGGDWWCMIQ